MELNWTTFLLEIVNFFILVWLLQRFFYRPVKNAIENRKKNIEKTVGEAEEIRLKATELEDRYRNRLKDWEREKDELRSSFLEELEKEKKAAHQQFEIQMKDERERIIEHEKLKGEEAAMKAQSDAFDLSLGFVSRMLSRLASSELEKRLIDLTIEQLSSNEIIESMRKNLGNGSSGNIVCASAYTMDGEQQSKLTDALKLLVNGEISVEFQLDDELISGLEITMGSYIIQANLKHELQYFAQSEQL